MYRNTIDDQILHTGINHNLKDSLVNFMEMDSRTRDVERDRIIRMNKANKDKKDTIKLRNLI